MSANSSSIDSAATTILRNNKSLRKAHSMPHMFVAPAAALSSSTSHQHRQQHNDINHHHHHHAHDCYNDHHPAGDGSHNVATSAAGVGGSCSLLDKITVCGEDYRDPSRKPLLLAKPVDCQREQQREMQQHICNVSCNSNGSNEPPHQPHFQRQQHQQRHTNAPTAAGCCCHIEPEPAATRSGCGCDEGGPKTTTTSAAAAAARNRIGNAVNAAQAVGKSKSSAAAHSAAAPYSVRLVADLRQLLTLRQHYYPEGGWGWVLVVVCFIIQSITHGLHLAVGVFVLALQREFRAETTPLLAVSVAALSFGVGLGFSPVTISLCKRKSTRLVAVIGGLVAALGCLFTSFALHLHQVAFSYGLMLGLGVNITRDCSTVMVAQYFKKRRELVEVFVVAGSGAGAAAMAAFYQRGIGAFGWRYGLQAIAATVFTTFILGLFYRSASLYHPQRRAILHLKIQRRKVKDKNRQSMRQPFFDCRTLSSKTVRIILLSVAISSLGLYVPVFLLAHAAQADGCCGRDGLLRMHIVLGCAWMCGCLASGVLVVRRSRECRIGRQYLCQTAACVVGVAQLMLALRGGGQRQCDGNAAAAAEAAGTDAMDVYVLFAGVYGAACGVWHYALKVYTYERVRARNFARAWSFVQCAQAPAVVLGMPLAMWMDGGGGGGTRWSFVWGAVCTVAGTAVLFSVDVHRRNIQRLQVRQQQELARHQSLRLLGNRGTAGDGGGGGGGAGGDGDVESGGHDGIGLAASTVGAASGLSGRQRLFRNISVRDGVGGGLLKLRRLSFSNEPENDSPFPYSVVVPPEVVSVRHATVAAVAAASAAGAAGATATALLLNSELLLSHISDELGDLSSVAAAAAAAAANSGGGGGGVSGAGSGADKAELTCISEEGIADMDLPDIDLFDDYEFIGDCITSCNKVENYLMLSEFENNLNVELPSSVHSLQARQTPCPNSMCHTNR